MREMDGRMRMFDSLRRVAAREQYSRRGVWSITGEPYQCYGEPEQVRLLPHILLGGPRAHCLSQIGPLCMSGCQSCQEAEHA